MDRQEVRDGSNPCIFRVAQEGLPFLLPHISKQILRLPLGEVQSLLTQRALRIPHDVPYTTVRPPQAKPAADADGAASGSGGAADAANGALGSTSTPAAAPTLASGGDTEPGKGAGAAGEEGESAADGAAADGAAADGAAADGAAADGAAADGAAADGAAADGGVVKAGGGAGPAGFGAEKQRAPLIETEETKRQLADINAGCCIVMLTCALALAWTPSPKRGLPPL
jgi:hypothetical protein